MVAEVTMDDGRNPSMCCRFDPEGCWQTAYGHWCAVGAIRPASNGVLLMRPLWPHLAASLAVAASVRDRYEALGL
jgi:hypothetical protein